MGEPSDAPTPTVKPAVLSSRVMAMAKAMKGSPNFDTGPQVLEGDDVPENTHRYQEYSSTIPDLFMPDCLTVYQFNKAILYLQELRAAATLTAADMIIADATKPLGQGVERVELIMQVSDDVAISATAMLDKTMRNMKIHHNSCSFIINNPSGSISECSHLTAQAYVDTRLQEALSKHCSGE